MQINVKKCPYCAEEILVEAIKCKHCGELLSFPYEIFQGVQTIEFTGKKRKKRLFIRGLSVVFGTVCLFICIAVDAPGILGPIAAISFVFGAGFYFSGMLWTLIISFIRKS